MLDTLKAIILDFQESEPFTGVPRMRSKNTGTRGGFPEVQGLDERLRVKVHQEYVSTILFRDVVERRCITNNTHTGKDVDFLAVQGGAKRLVQVSETLAQEQTRRREVSALAQAMEELGIEKGTIVTRNEQEPIETEAGRIDVVPAWKFVLERSWA